jgi:hypothetical protein
VFWAGNGESRQDYHWIGHEKDTEQGSSMPGDQKKNSSQNRKDKTKYRPLADITLGEVEEAYTLYEHQLSPAQENWIGKHYFCQIPLKRGRGYPPLIFGRVKTCYPSDGFLGNVEELEMVFPHRDEAPDLVHIHKDEISRSSQRQVQSYIVKVRVLASDQEKTELTGTDPLLGKNGLYPDFESGYLDLLEMTEQTQSVYPRMFVIGSRWFSSIPESLHAEMKGKLKEMLGWGKQIFNYHPEWLGNEINTLNRELGFKYGFTPILLTEPGNAEETAIIVAKTFEREILFNPKAEK